MTEVAPAKTTLDSKELQQEAHNVREVAAEIGEAIEKMVERIVANPVDAIQGISEEDKKRIAEQQIEMCSLLERSLTTLIGVDAQFSRIATQIDGWLKAHNNLVDHLNQTLLNKNYLLSIIDGRVKEIEEMRMREHNTVLIKNQLTTVDIFSKKDTREYQPGQYVTYIVYPDNATNYSSEEIDSLSYNVVKVCDEAGTLQDINRNEQPELFAAVSLKFSEEFTNSVTEGKIVPENIQDKNGKEYTLLNYIGVFEIQGISTEEPYPLSAD